MGHILKSIAAVAAILSFCCLSSCKRQVSGATSSENPAEQATAPSVENVQTEETGQDLDKLYAVDMLSKGETAPAFNLKSPDGKDVSLAGFKGKYVVLDFWATWCPDCRKDVPALKELHKKYSSDKIAFLSISFDTDKEQWAAYINENGMDWNHASPLMKWKETQISKDYHVKWIPSMYLIGPDGKVVFGTVLIDRIGNALEEIAGK